MVGCLDESEVCGITSVSNDCFILLVSLLYNQELVRTTRFDCFQE